MNQGGVLLFKCVLTFVVIVVTGMVGLMAFVGSGQKEREVLNLLATDESKGNKRSHSFEAIQNGKKSNLRQRLSDKSPDELLDEFRHRVEKKGCKLEYDFSTNEQCAAAYIDQQKNHHQLLVFQNKRGQSVVFESEERIEAEKVAGAVSTPITLPSWSESVFSLQGQDHAGMQMHLILCKQDVETLKSYFSDTCRNEDWTLDENLNHELITREKDTILSFYKGQKNLLISFFEIGQNTYTSILQRQK